MEFEHVTVAITHPGLPVRLMHFHTVGRGNILPRGAQYLASAPGWWERPPHDDLIEEQVARASVGWPPYTWRVLDEMQVPHPEADRTYRNAWVEEKGAIKHDMEMAKDWHRKMMRNERVERLLVLDWEWMKANGQKRLEDAQLIEDQRQTLRDALDDPRIDVATTIEELKQIRLP